MMLLRRKKAIKRYVYTVGFRRDCVTSRCIGIPHTIVDFFPRCM